MKLNRDIQLILMVFIACLFGYCKPSRAQTITAPTRVTPYDYQCQDANGVKISDHQQQGLAIVACINDPKGAYVQGGKYKINRVVVSPTTGSTTITCTPPTQNTDNSALTDLAGFKVYYGTSASTLTQVKDFPGTSGCTNGMVIGSLSTGTWYFAVAAYNAANAQSDYSNVTSKVVQ